MERARNVFGPRSRNRRHSNCRWLNIVRIGYGSMYTFQTHKLVELRSGQSRGQGCIHRELFGAVTIDPWRALAPRWQLCWARYLWYPQRMGLQPATSVFEIQKALWSVACTSQSNGIWAPIRGTLWEIATLFHENRRTYIQTDEIPDRWNEKDHNQRAMFRGSPSQLRRS